MYTEGVKIGDNSYLLQDNDELVLATITGTTEQMEEYLQVANNCDEKLEEKYHLQNRLSEIYNNDKKAKKINIKTFIITSILEGVFLTLSFMTGSFPIDLLIFTPTICICTGIIAKIATYGTKKQRTKIENFIKSELSIIQNELKEIKTKKDTLKSQIEYQEIELKEDKIIPVTTIENKKSNVKMRLLKLEQSR